MSTDAFPPAAFHFALRIDPAAGGGDVLFQEVSGIGAETVTEAVQEGGENRFVHALPRSLKHPRLTLKRGLAAADSGLVAWCRQVLEGGLAQPIQTRPIEVHLIGAAGEVVRRWRFSASYPVKWSVEPFHSNQQQVALEVVELAYREMERVA